MNKKDNKYVIKITHLLKQSSRTGHHLSAIELVSYPDNINLCIVSLLDLYIEKTADLRSSQQLMCCYTKPFKAASKDTLSRWIKLVMKKAGIDTDIFKTT